MNYRISKKISSLLIAFTAANCASINAEEITREPGEYNPYIHGANPNFATTSIAEALSAPSALTDGTVPPPVINTLEDAYNALGVNLSNADPLPWNPSQQRYDAGYSPFGSVGMPIITHQRQMAYANVRDNTGRNTLNFSPYSARSSADSTWNTDRSFIETKRRATERNYFSSHQGYNQNGLRSTTSITLASGKQGVVEMWPVSYNGSSWLEGWVSVQDEGRDDTRSNATTANIAIKTYPFLVRIGDQNLAEMVPSANLGSDFDSCSSLNILGASTATGVSDSFRPDDLLFVQFCGIVSAFPTEQIFTRDATYRVAENNTSYLITEGLSLFYADPDPSKLEKLTIAVGNVDETNDRDDLFIAVSRKEGNENIQSFIRKIGINSDGSPAGYHTRSTNDFHPTSIAIGNIDNDPGNELIVGGTNYSSGNNQLQLKVWQTPINQSFRNGGWDSNMTLDFTAETSFGDYARLQHQEIKIWDPYVWRKGKLIVFAGSIWQKNHNDSSTWDNSQEQGIRLVERLDYSVGVTLDYPGFSLASTAVGHFTLNATTAIDQVRAQNGESSETYSDRFYNDNQEELFVIPYVRTAWSGEVTYCDARAPVFALLPKVNASDTRDVTTIPYLLPQNLNSSVVNFRLHLFQENIETNAFKQGHCGANTSRSKPQPVAVDLRGDHFISEYTGGHTQKISSPDILAAAAFPPFWSGSNRLETGNLLRLGFSETAGSTYNVGKAINVNVSLGIQLAFDTGVYAGSISARGYFNRDHDEGFEESSYQTVSNYFYERSGNGEVVSDKLLINLPIADAYEYRVISSAGLLTSEGSTFELIMERAPYTSFVDVDAYNVVMESIDPLLVFDKNDYWTHSLGDPSSYRNRREYEALNNVAGLATNEALYNTNSGIGLELSSLNGLSNYNTYSVGGGATVDWSLGTTNVKMIGSISAGAARTSGNSTSLSEGFSVFAAIEQSYATDPIGSGFATGMFWRSARTASGNDIMLIDYWVEPGTYYTP